MPIRSSFILFLTLCVPSVGFTQAGGYFNLVFSPLEWWVIIGAILIGILVSVSMVMQGRQSPVSESAQSDDDRLSSLEEIPPSSGAKNSRYIGFYAASGLLFGMWFTVASEIQAVYSLIIAAVILLFFALTLFGILKLNFFQHQFLEGILGNRRIGLAVGLILGILTVILLNAVFQFGNLNGDLQKVAGIAVALVAGMVFGEFFLKVVDLKNIDADQAKFVRTISGIATLALAIFVAGKIQAFPSMFIWSAFLITLAVYCGATTKMHQPAAGHKLLLKGGGIVVLIFGAIGLVSASIGYRNFSQPIVQISALVSSGGIVQTNQGASSVQKVFTYVTSIDEYDAMLVKANQVNKPLMVDFYADWCLDCKRMDRTTFKDPSIVGELTQNFSSIKIDVTDPNDEFGRTLRKRYQVFGPPALLFIDRNGALTSNSPVYGYLDVEELTALLVDVK